MSPVMIFEVDMSSQIFIQYSYLQKKRYFEVICVSWVLPSKDLIPDFEDVRDQ
jgi:hypothetical protein